MIPQSRRHLIACIFRLWQFGEALLLLAKTWQIRYNRKTPLGHIRWAIVQWQDPGFWYQLCRFESCWPSQNSKVQDRLQAVFYCIAKCKGFEPMR